MLDRDAFAASGSRYADEGLQSSDAGSGFRVEVLLAGSPFGTGSILGGNVICIRRRRADALHPTSEGRGCDIDAVDSAKQVSKFRSCLPFGVGGIHATVTDELVLVQASEERECLLPQVDEKAVGLTSVLPGHASSCTIEDNAGD